MEPFSIPSCSCTAAESPQSTNPQGRGICYWRGRNSQRRWRDVLATWVCWAPIGALEEARTHKLAKFLDDQGLAQQGSVVCMGPNPPKAPGRTALTPHVWPQVDPRVIYAGQRMVWQMVLPCHKRPACWHRVQPGHTVKELIQGSTTQSENNSLMWTRRCVQASLARRCHVLGQRFDGC